MAVSTSNAYCEATPRNTGTADSPVRVGIERSRYRVAMIAACPFPAARGTPARIYRMAEELARRGHHVSVFTYHLGDAAGDARFAIRRIVRVRTYRKETPGPSYQKLFVLDPLLCIMLLRAVLSNRFDVIHAHHVEGLLVGLPAHWLARIPLVFDVHTLLENELPFYGMALTPGILRFAGGALDRHLPIAADHVIAVSKDIRDKLTNRHGIKDDCISVIPNGVEDAFFRDGDDAGGTPLPSDAAAPILVFAGNLAAYQRFELLLQAVAIARRTRPDIRLHVLTDSAADAYRPLIAELGLQDRTDFIAVHLRDLPARLAEAHIALNPRTECDGLPQKLLNYMAAGLPVVSFAGSARYLVHQERALIVDDEDVAAFADAIVRLIEDPALARALGDAGRAFVREHLSWERNATATEAVYERVRRRYSRGPSQ